MNSFAGAWNVSEQQHAHRMGNAAAPPTLPTRKRYSAERRGSLNVEYKQGPKNKRGKYLGAICAPSFSNSARSHNFLCRALT